MHLLAEFGTVEKSIVTGLAVAGGFLTGFVVANLLSRGLAKFVFHKSPPDRLLRFTKLLGGAAGALLVYYMMGEGGFGVGGRGGGHSPDEQKGKPFVDITTEETKVEPKLVKKDSAPVQPVTVYVLPVSKKSETYYRIQHDEKPLTVEQVLQWIDDRKVEQKPVKVVRIEFIDKDNTDVEARKTLKDALEKKQIEVILVADSKIKAGE